jgi:hypothetical protein
VPTQRPVNAAGLEPRRPASLFHFIPRRSSDRQRLPVIPLSRASPRSLFVCRTLARERKAGQLLAYYRTTSTTAYIMRNATQTSE